MPTHRVIAFTILIATLLAIVVAPVGAARATTRASLQTSTPSADDADELLAARLGGTRRSFTDTYGEPTETLPGIGVLYAVDGYGLFAIQFQPGEEPNGNDRAVLITLRSPRPEEAPALTPDPADWNLDEALERAKDVLPADAELEKVTPGDAPGNALVACRSEALAAVLSTDGQCRLNFVLPTTDSVSFIMIALGSATANDAASTPVAAPDDPCAGFVDWATATADRVTEATDILSALENLDPNAAETAGQLRVWSARFALLADEQRASASPSAAERANRLLADAFAAYGSALNAAADALVARDEAGMADATRLLEGANTDLARGDQALSTALNRCGLGS